MYSPSVLYMYTCNNTSVIEISSNIIIFSVSVAAAHFIFICHHIEQLYRNVLSYTTTHEEQLKAQALSTHGLRLVQKRDRK